MATIRKRSWSNKKGKTTKYVLDFVDCQGIRQRKNFDKKYDADKYRVKIENELRSGIHVSKSEKFKAVSVDFISQCKVDKIERSTYEDYESVLNLYILPEIGHDLLTEITTPRVTKLLQNLRKDTNLSDIRITRVKIVISSVFNHGIGQGSVFVNPVSSVRLRKRRRISENEENVIFPAIEQLKTIIRCEGLSPQDRVIINLAVMCGLRTSELFALCWRHIDFKNNLILVRQRVDKYLAIGAPKTKKSRRDVPIPENMVLILKEWKLQISSSKDDLLFTNSAGKIHDRGNWNIRTWNRYMKSLRLGDTDKEGNFSKWYQFRFMRHAYASLLIMANTNPKRLQINMGHEKIQTTFDLYGHLFPDDDDKQAAVDKAVRVLF